MRKLFLMLALALGAMNAAPTSAKAAGLLQDLFARLERSAPVAYNPPAPVYRYAPVEPHLKFVGDEKVRIPGRPQIDPRAKPARQQFRVRPVAPRLFAVPRLSPKIAVRTAPRVKVASLSPDSLKFPMPSKVANAAIAIEADATLRAGDAFMTEKGLRVFRGRTSGAPGADGFVAYRNANLRENVKARLSQVEQPVPGGDVIASAPAKLAAVKVVDATYAKRMSLDPNGRPVRVVGP